MNPIPLAMRLLLGVVVLTLTLDAGAETPRPNVLYIMGDDARAPLTLSLALVAFLAQNSFGLR